MLLDLLQQEVGTSGPEPKGATSRSVVRGFGTGFRIPQAFTELQNQFGVTPVPNAATLWGDNYSPRAQFSSWRAEPFNESPPYATDATLWGDNYSPYAQFRQWTARAFNDNPVFAFEVPVTGIVGDGYQPRAFYSQWRAQPVNDNPVFDTSAILWGDGFAPYVQFKQWTARAFNDNPCFAFTPTVNAIFGDSFVPRAQFNGWNARAIFDTTAFAQPAILFGSEFIPQRPFTFNRVPSMYASLVAKTGGLFPPSTPAGGVVRKQARRRWSRSSS